MRTARQRDMQSSGRIRRPHIVSETPPPPEMTAVFPPRKRLTEEPVGLARAGPPDSRAGRARLHPLGPRTILCRGRLARSPDRVDDVLVAGAPAEITLEPGADAFLRRLRFTPEQFQRAHDHSRGAETALQGVMLAECGLQRMLGITWLTQALDRVDRCSVRLNGQDSARLHGAAIEVHGTRAALGRIATDMRTSDAEVIAQEVHEQPPGVNLSLPPLAVDGNGDAMT
jgi:hypothetical protein